MPAETAWPIAAEWFAELGAAAAAEGVTVVLEANPTDYAADFITHGADALRMVRAVNSPGLKLHLDTACMTLAGDALGLITSGVELLAHFHVSEPMLEPVGGDSSKVNHPAFAQTLRGSGYRGHVSIEMKSSPSPVDAVRRAIRFVRRSYG
jgi:sugar phosphate isomerase/epimerase